MEGRSFASLLFLWYLRKIKLTILIKHLIVQMKLNFKLIVAALSLSLAVKSQNTVSGTTGNNPPAIKRGCGTQAPSPEWDKWFNSKVEEYKTNLAQGKVQAVSLTIPVIVHVIHGGQAVGSYPNISAAQIKSQISVLNKDFAGIGYNSYQLAATGFSAVGIANTHITFCLAQLDPSGTPLTEPGIHRVNYNSQGWTNPASFTSQTNFRNYFDATIKPNTIWDPTYYFNIWVSDVDNNNVGLLGYATFPGGSALTGIPSGGGASNDGIWVWGRSFGSGGSAQAPYALGRTATHETGHYLGLRHIGGDAANPAGDCNATDFCNDTPPQLGGFSGGSNGQNFGNPSYPLHVGDCPSAPYGDMFMNFMDYSDDAYCYMFTPDQDIRIQTAMANGYFRNQLSPSSATLCSGLPIVDVLMDTLYCNKTNITLINQTNGSPTPTYSWSAVPSGSVVFSPGSTDPNPTVNFDAPGVYTLNMVATNTAGVNSFYVVLQIDDCTGIKESSGFSNAISISPNPGSGRFILKTEAAAGESIEVIVHNSLGQLVLSKNYSNVGTSVFTMDLSSQPDGIYTLSISNGKERAVKRLVLTR